MAIFKKSVRSDRKFVDADLEALLNEKSYENQEELVRSLKIIQETISKRL